MALGHHTYRVGGPRLFRPRLGVIGSMSSRLCSFLQIPEDEQFGLSDKVSRRGNAEMDWADLWKMGPIRQKEMR